MTFSYWDHEYEYFDHEYNDTRQNERAIEIPIAQAFIGEGAGLELGNVLSHYGPVDHRVVDKYEGPETLDVFDIQGSYDWIVAVSTLEHVRWDEGDQDPDGSGEALRHLLGLLKPNGGMLVTVPFGWQPFFDSDILGGEFPVGRECSFIRNGDGWYQTKSVEHRRYAASTRWAESVWVAEFA